jgi:hypothetical protein
MPLNWMYADASVLALDAGASTASNISVVNPDGVPLPVDGGIDGRER